MISFFFEVLIGGLLSGVMYSLVALGFVLIYKASGVFNFAQGSMVFFAALTFVGLTEHGLSLRCRARCHARGDDRARPPDRAPRAASARQPAADLAVHGDDRAVVLHRRPCAVAVGRQRARARARNTGRADQVAVRCRRHQRVEVRSRRRGHRRGARRRARRSSSAAPGSAARCAPSPTIIRRRSPSAFRCSRSGASSGRSPASSRSSPACCGARATASSLR